MRHLADDRPSARKPGRTLIGVLAAAGLLPAATWLRRRLRPPSQLARSGPSASGEIQLAAAGATWVFRADLALPAAALGWLVVEGPQYRQAQVSVPGTGPLAFTLPAGGPGCYRFWILASRSRRETLATLARRAGKAAAAGEFHIS